MEMDSDSLTSNLFIGPGSSKFRPLIEVSTMQEAADLQTPRPIQYKNVGNSISSQDLATRLLFEIGFKLRMKATTIAIAARIYHQFCDAAKEDCYDPYLFAATCLYIASKGEDEPVKIRDLINVSHRTLNRDSDVLELGEEYWNYRDSIVQAELLVMRMISFKIPTPNSHLFLLSYMKTLQAWIPPHVWDKTSLPKLCWTFLQDFHHSKTIIHHEPQLVALAAISLALQTYGIQIPSTTEQDQKPWHEVFHPEAKRDVIWNLIEQLLDVYEYDKKLSS